MTQIFLVNQNAAGSFPDPGNWNPANNSVEVVGSGGYGASPPTGGECTQPPCRAYELPLKGETVWEHYNVGRSSGRQFVWNGDFPWTVEELNWTPPTGRDYPTVGSVTGSGNGGGGGGYARDINLSPTFPWPYYIQGSISSSGGVRYYTVWGRNTNMSQPPQTPGWVWASAGNGGFDGGSFGTGWPNGQNGGNGGASGSAGFNGGGGGGAGGPHGIGTGGAAGNSGGAGGAADGGTVPGGAAGAAGNSGTQWDATHGVGSGSGGGTSTNLGGGVAANYGGGAGGGYGADGAPSVAGGQSIIVVTYAPVLSAGSAFIIV